MHNNYFSYSLNKRNNVILFSFFIVLLIAVLLFIRFVFFAQNWEDNRLVDKKSSYSDIPILDKNGLDYFVNTKGQNIKDDVIAPEKGD